MAHYALDAHYALRTCVVVGDAIITQLQVDALQHPTGPGLLQPASAPPVAARRCLLVVLLYLRLHPPEPLR